MSIIYGKKWRVLISKNGTTCLDVSQLDILFNIPKSMGDNGNSCNITIYNLSQVSLKKHVTEGSRIIIEAGYKYGPYGMIFDGDVIDAIPYKEGGVTRVLQIKAKDGDLFLRGGFISQSAVAGMTTADQLNMFVGQGDPNITLGEISPSLAGIKLPRGKALYGQPGTLLDNLARSEGGRAFICDRKIHLVKADDPPKGQIFSLTSQSGLIGSPEQTEDGIKATCLLNPALNINKFVHIKSDNIIRQSKKAGDKTAVADLKGSGIYKILKLDHDGDTAGNNWYTNIIGIPQPGLTPVKLKSFIR